MRRSEVSDLKLVIAPFLVFAIPVRILNLGNKVAFPENVDGRDMLLRRRSGVYCAVALSI